MEDIQPITLEQRKLVLSTEISKYLQMGFHVLNQTDTTAQMQKDKDFSCFLFLILLLLGILPGIFYAILQKNKHAHITIDEYGKSLVNIDYNDKNTAFIMVLVILVSLYILISLFSS